MSIETTSHASGAHKASSGHDARGAKGRAAGAADASAQGPQGFLSILSAMGESDGGETAGILDAAVTDPATSLLAGALPGTTAQDLGAAPPPVDPSALLAQSAQLAAPTAGATPLPPSGALLKGPATEPVAALPAGVPLTGQPLESAAGAAAAPGTAEAGQTVRQSGLTAAREGTATLQQAAADTNGPTIGAKKHAPGAGRDKKNPLPDQASAVASVATQKEAPKDARQLVAAEIQKALQPLQALMQTAISEMARTEKRSDGRSVFAAPAATDSAAAAASVGTSDTGFSLAAPTEAAAPAEVQVAEPVHYWTSNEVQNAEMTLEGLGENPVEVSIRMQGNEAHVAFRSDESATRGILQGAEGQLKDMLQREGLQLAGVYVGTSGPNGQGAQSGKGDGERRPREGVRSARVAPAGLEPLNVPRQSTTGSNRTVDLFV